MTHPDFLPVDICRPIKYRTFVNDVIFGINQPMRYAQSRNDLISGLSHEILKPSGVLSRDVEKDKMEWFEED